MVEFDQQIGIRDIVHLNAYAETFGLGVNVFTLDEDNYADLVLEIASDVDILTIEPNREFAKTQSIESIFIRVKNLIKNN
jgi:hypothetical protein